MSNRTLHPAAALAGAAAAVAAAAAVRAFLIEPARVEVARHDMPLPDLPEPWHGATVVHLSDLHYGDPRSETLFRWMVRTVNAAEPDLVVITGDFIHQKRSEVDPCVAHLSGLRSRHGILAVSGDHDYARKPLRLEPRLRERLAESGVRLLENDAVELPGGLRVAGVCPTTHKFARADLPAALAPLGDQPPHLLLSHSPDIVADASERGLPMVLAGHTHGGQVVVPFYGPPLTHSRFGREHASGWSRRGATRVYTSRGLASHYSLRFLCPPEITLFTLVPAEGELNHEEHVGLKAAVATAS